MPPWVTPTTGPGRRPEGFVLDPDSICGPPIDLGTSTGWLQLSSLTIPPAQKLPQWAANADSDGQQLVRTPFYGNRDCTMQIRVYGRSGDEAMGAIGALEAKLQEADKLAPDGGLPVLWTPTGSSTGLRLYMLLAQITDMPVTVDDGWFAHKPHLTVAFVCKPFLYGEEQSTAIVSGSGPLLTLEVPDVPGDVPAEARLVVTDGSSQARRFVEWGLEQMYYDASSPAPLVIDSADLVTSGFAGAGTAHSGAYGGTTIAAPLFSQSVAVCGIGAQPHVGSYRIKGRLYGPSRDEYWRLTWRESDGPFRTNDPVRPVVAHDFSEVDLGIVTVAPTLEGSQQWSGRIEAWTTTPGGETGEIDDLLLYPVNEGYAPVAGSYAYRPGVISGHDEFTGTLAGTALGGRVAPTGGTWVTSGASTDFTFTGPTFVPTPDTATRATSADADYRYAILGAGGHTDTEAGVSCWAGSADPSGFTTESILIVRWTNANNYVRLRLERTLAALATLSLEQVVAGVVTTLASSTATLPLPFRLRVVAFASGRAIGWLLDNNGNIMATVDGAASALATGGVLASGAAGFGDRSSGVPQRFYDNFYAGVPAVESVVINAGRSLEIRSDSNLRQSADATSYGDIVGRGSRLFIPPAGPKNRTTRIAVRATRANLTTMADTSVLDGDTLQAQVFYTPRYLAVPR